MADDKKNIPETDPPAEAPAPAVENAAVPEQTAPDPVLTDKEAVILEHEGQAALFEIGEAVPDHGDPIIYVEVEESAAPEAPKAEKEKEQPSTPGNDDPAPATSGKVVDFAAAREEAGKTTPPAKESKKPEQSRRGRPSKGDKAASGKADTAKKDKATPSKAEKPKRDKMSQSKAPAPKEEAIAPTKPEQPAQPRDTTRAEKEEIVYLNLSELHPFQNHPFGVRDDAEM